MQKLDRLVWADGFCIRSFGKRIGVRLSAAAPEGKERLLASLPPGWEPCEPPFVDYLYSLKLGGVQGRLRNYHLLHGGLMRLARTFDVEEVVRAFERDLHLFVAEWAHDRVFVHAGVVGWKGRAVLLPGRSLAGK